LPLCGILIRLTSLQDKRVWFDMYRSNFFVKNLCRFSFWWKICCGKSHQHHMFCAQMSWNASRLPFCTSSSLYPFFSFPFSVVLPWTFRRVWIHKESQINASTLFTGKIVHAVRIYSIGARRGDFSPTLLWASHLRRCGSVGLKPPPSTRRAFKQPSPLFQTNLLVLTV